ncbi:hypothetical protein [Amycolatopsis sp. CA-230715]|uniref:hypothetical protein n=1 Tax=Amycolatopsis sp. CA-230715 TaxID=2745196 RepID=UPI001C014382|nr:hypothetical protein [Amycolatopsis sp. CA-230715]QWF81915.1 hypothetical protein HUW46_05350 [Amycolatopsis sp. CA-230715]
MTDPFPVHPGTRKKNGAIAGIAALGAVAALGVGLGIGLTARPDVKPAAAPAPIETTVTATVSRPASTVTAPPSTVVSTVTAPPEVPAEPVQTGPKTEFSDGMYAVGTDIAAGSYRTPGGEDLCFWSRDRNDSGDFNAIITNDAFKGPGSVTVKKGEFLKVSGGCTWKKK